MKRTDPLLPLQQFPHILQENGRPAENHGLGDSLRIVSSAALAVDSELHAEECPVSLCFMAVIGPCRFPRNPVTATLHDVKHPRRKNIRTMSRDELTGNEEKCNSCKEVEVGSLGHVNNTVRELQSTDLLEMMD